jgi:hypothetical protein
MKNEVKIWKNNGSKWQEAVALLLAFGVKLHKSVERFKDRPSANAWCTDWVRRHLEALTDDQEAVTATQSAGSDGVRGVKRGVDTATATIAAAKNVTKFTAEQKALQQQHSLAHSEMRTATTDEARFAAAATIMEEIIPAKEAAYANAEAALAQAPPAEAEKQASTTTLSAEDVLRRNSCRAQVSKLKGKIKNATDDVTRRKLENKLAEYEAELVKYQ